MYPILQIGGAALPLRPFIFLAAAWLCLTWTEQRLPRYGLKRDLAWNAGLLAGGVALVSARLWYALTHGSAYASNLSALVAPNIATLALSEGALVGLLAGFIYLRRERVPLLDFADALAPDLLLAFGLNSLGALLSGDAYGAPASVPWAIELWGARRHPSQVYELLVAAAALAALWHLGALPRGFTFFSAAALYASGRVFVEAFRGDSLLVGDGVRAMQVLWLALALGALVWMYRRSAAPLAARTDAAQAQSVPARQ